MIGPQELRSPDECVEVGWSVLIVGGQFVVPRRYRVFVWLAPLLGMSWLTLCVLDPDPGRGVSETLGFGYFFGSMLAHTTLAAAWNAFGPAGWFGACHCR